MVRLVSDGWVGVLPMCVVRQLFNRTPEFYHEPLCVLKGTLRCSSGKRRDELENFCITFLR